MPPPTGSYVDEAEAVSNKSRAIIERAIKVAEDLGDKMLATSLAAIAHG